MEKSIILANDISEISRLYEFVEEVGNDFELSPDIVFNLNLVLEEAVVNIINYAYPKEEHESIYLSARMHEGSIQIGGLGIFLIRQIMNEVKYERIEGKNVLTLEKKL